MATTTTSFLKPEHVAPIRSLNIRAKIIVEGLIAGLHRSPYHGFSAEFLEYRPYLQGESTRRIDWRKYARTDRIVVRLFEDETNLYARIILDKSASMRFASPPNMSKYEYGRTLAASLAWILIRQRDAVGLAVFDEALGFAMQPKSTNVQLRNIIAELERIEPTDGTHSGKAIEQVAHTINKRGLSIVISDLLDDPEDIIRGLRHLRFKKQDVIVIWLLDPLEHDFTRDAPLEIHDLETLAKVRLDGETAARVYAESLREHRGTIERACKELQIDCETVTTDQPFHRALLRIMERRRRLF